MLKSKGLIAHDKLLLHPNSTLYSIEEALNYYSAAHFEDLKKGWAFAFSW